MYFINGDEPLPARPGERAHLGCNWVDVVLELTGDQPTYWSAASGNPAGVSPWTVLDPGSPNGRPDPDGSTDRVLRGYVLAWAVDPVTGAEIHWNHLKGDAVIVNYANQAAWEYNAYSFQALMGSHGSETDPNSPGVLNLNGVEYDSCFSQLLLDFYAVGSTALSRRAVAGSPNLPVTVNTDLTLFPVDRDLRQETEGPVTTKAKFDIWNQNEHKFSNTERCITCWDQALLSNYEAPNHFLLGNLQTNKGKARIEGLASQECDVDFDPSDGLALGEDPRDTVSQDAALLGVAAKLLAFAAPNGNAMAGMDLVGMGTEDATIQYDFQGGPPPESPPPPPGGGMQLRQKTFTTIDEVPPQE
jgi:hypothetical protein